MLTVEELKNIPIGEWVWLTDGGGNLGSYVAKSSAPYKEDDKTFNFDSLAFSHTYPYSTYGTKWRAYKNKEEAEGRSITFPCVRPIVFTDGNGVTMYELVFSDKYGMVQTEMYRDDQLQEAKERLKELNGEN